MSFFACPESDTPLRFLQNTQARQKKYQLRTKVSFNRAPISIVIFSLNTEKSVRFESGLQRFQVSESESRVGKNIYFGVGVEIRLRISFSQTRRRGSSLTRISSLTLSNILILIIKRSWARKYPRYRNLHHKYCNLDFRGGLFTDIYFIQFIT